MGMGRTALELRVGLGGHEERVAAALQLDELHQGAVGRGTADVQPGGLETVPVGVVDLVTMAVSLLTVVVPYRLATRESLSSLAG